MEWIVTTGKTVAEAVEAALDELGVDEADIEFEVLEEPRRGFLGRLGGGSPARIKARVKPLSREKPDRRRRGAGRERERGAGAERPPRPRAGRPLGERSERVESDRATSSRPGRDRPSDGAGGARVPAPDEKARSGAGEATAESGSGGAGEAGTERQARSAAGNRRRRKKPQSVSGSPKASPAAAGSNGEEEEAVFGSDVSLEEQAELAEGFTRGFVERFGLEASVAARVDGNDDVYVDVEGSDLGLLIGPRAATIDAIQELVRTAVGRRIGGHGARIHVDAAGYRARRQEALADFTREAARRALDSGRDQVFEPMAPADRKVVHDTVNEIEGVSTISEGEEPRRRVVIKAGAGSS